MINVKNLPIGEVLKEYGYITEEQLQGALEYQKEHRGKRLGTVLIERGYITESQMLEALGQRLHLQQVSLSGAQIDINAVACIPENLAEQYCMLGMKIEGKNLTVAMKDPLNFFGVEDVRQATGYHISILLSEEAPLRRAIHYYYSEISARKAAEKANTILREPPAPELETPDGEGDAPIIQLLNSLVQRAYNTNASDIHIEPFENKTLVRMRIDGTIVDYVTLQKGIHASLIARIKIVSDLDIAEKRLPQDGHCQIRVDRGPVNIRVSLIPTVYGEKAVLRLLANNVQIDCQETYGMAEEDYRRFSEIMRSPNGIIYITGPTGSGKSTTLYMVLEELAKGQVNISTIENPVEKKVPRLNQMQVNTTAGLTFESGLRALLRQDPDIIMVGETRDAETASISVRAAITGHLVFSTLHTNSAMASVVRLIDMGLAPYLVANSVVGLMAQRLMRKVCPHCCELRKLREEEKYLFEADLIPEQVKEARGCDRCHYTGYSGRIAVHEIVKIDRVLREMITSGASLEKMEEYAKEQQGMKTLRRRAGELTAAGITTVEELQKIAYYT